MKKYTILGDLITPAKVVRCGKGNYPVLSMTMHDGIVLQSDRFKKSLASADQSDYKVVEYGKLVIGFPIDEGVLYIQKVAPEGIMSPAYSTWDVDTTRINPDFLELCLHSPQSMQYYKDKLRSTTARRRSIPTADLLALRIRTPDMESQLEAVAVARKVDEMIAIRHAQATLLDQLVKSILAVHAYGIFPIPRGCSQQHDRQRRPTQSSCHLLGELPRFCASTGTAGAICRLRRPDRQIKIGSTARTQRAGNSQKIPDATILWLRKAGAGWWYTTADEVYHYEKSIDC